MSESRAYFLMSLGEPLLRLSPPGLVQLRRARSLEVVVAGSQMNVAADLAQLGRRTALLTRLPENPLGLLAADACRGYGIDTSFIQMAPGGKMGTTYVEFSAAPRTPLAVYDRAGSAASTIGPDSFDWPGLLARSRFAYTDGIFPGLGEGCRTATAAFLKAARAAGCTTVFDPNYREHLWPAEDAARAYRELLPMVDVLVTSRGVSQDVLGFGGTDEQIMERYALEFSCRLVCMTSREILPGNRGAWTSRARHDGRILEGRRQEFDVVDRYGTGDAWLGAFLHGCAEGDVAYALDFANAAIALAHTTFGDVAHLTVPQILAVMNGPADMRVRR